MKKEFRVFHSNSTSLKFNTLKDALEEYERPESVFLQLEINEESILTGRGGLTLRIVLADKRGE